MEKVSCIYCTVWVLLFFPIIQGKVLYEDIWYQRLLYLVATDVVTSDVTKVTGRSLESIIFVEAIEELKNFEVILLTAPFILSDFFFVDNIVEVATYK